MPGVIGNKNGRGKKGRSGRKSAYQELKNTQRLWELWTDQNLPNKLKEKVKKGEPMSVEEMHLFRGYIKSDANLNKIFGKLYPDSMKIEDDFMPYKIIVKKMDDSSIKSISNSESVQKVA